jgi:hypothetical protein
VANRTFQTPDLAGHRILIGADHLAHVLGVELRRQRRRADQIAKQHRQLPPLSPGRTICLLSGSSFARRRSSITNSLGEVGDRPQQLLAVAEQDAKLLQVGLGDVGQHLVIDRVRFKRVGVALQPKFAQPRRNVHGVPRTAIEIGTRHYQDDARRATSPLSGGLCRRLLWGHDRPLRMSGNGRCGPGTIRQISTTSMDLRR